MAIPVGEDIGAETHRAVEQIVFVTIGTGRAVVDGVEVPVAPGSAVVFPPGAHHDLVNTGVVPLRLYTVYSPPNHIAGRVQQTKADAEADRADKAYGDAVR
jgi:mannose-6-phosphate isomerase-like protein (cupin superfamily)